MGITPPRVARTVTMSATSARPTPAGVDRTSGKDATSVPSAHGRRGGSTWAAFLVGLPLAVGFLLAVDRGLLANPVLERYLSHLVERVEVVLFGCALGTLAAKWLG